MLFNSFSRFLLVVASSFKKCEDAVCWVVREWSHLTLLLRLFCWASWFWVWNEDGGYMLVLEEMEGGEGGAELGGEGMEGGIGVFSAEGEDLLGEGLVEDRCGYGVGVG